AELGLRVEPSYLAAAGAESFDLVEGVRLSGDGFPFDDPADRADYERVEQLFAELIATVDPDDPWSHPDAARLDASSVAGWLRSVGARPATVRALQVGSLALADGSIERT
ncbi:MAG TPA: hypothetical protein VH950_09805, partial [Gaiellaceae bacterium]